MLCLTRKEGQRLTIDTPVGPISLLVDRIGGSQCRFVIDAPAECQIIRSEAKSHAAKARPSPECSPVADHQARRIDTEAAALDTTEPIRQAAQREREGQR